MNETDQVSAVAAVFASHFRELNDRITRLEEAMPFARLEPKADVERDGDVATFRIDRVNNLIVPVD